MSRIKSKNTKPEMLVRKFLFSKGLRYRLHGSNLPGKPDLVFPKYKTVVFVHGCFWHMHKGCKYFVVPKTRTDWWLKKLERNCERDKLNVQKLKSIDWKVMVVWECELKEKIREKTLQKLFKDLIFLYIYCVERRF